MADSKEKESSGVKYPKGLFKKAVVIVSNHESNDIKNSQNHVGYVAQETDELIVVFSESNRNLRFDIPKSIISVAGNSVIIDSNEILSKYKVKRDDPLPQVKPSAEIQEGQITKRQTEPIIEYYKTPVHATFLPTIEMTKKSEAQIGRNGAEKTASETIQKEDTKAKESQGAPLTLKQPPNYQTLPVKKSDIHNSIHEGDTADETKKSHTTSIVPKTIIEKQNETMAQSELQSQDKGTETLVEVLSTMPAEKEVDRQVVNEPLERTALDRNKGEQQELPVQDIGVSKQDVDANVDRIDLPSSGDYVYPFTISMALWQDFALSAIQMYNEFARELSKVNGTWMNIFLNVWHESSNHENNENK